MERRFRCTACGKCCYGWLPLTVKDALRHARRFPLAVVWTPVRQASKAFAATAKLGLTVRTRDRKQLAIRIAPTAYIPPSFPCPALTADNLCGIQAEKPSRCATMPFFPYRDEADQSDLLVPRPGWACDTSPEAPVVYRDKAIIARTAFALEYGDLLEQAPVLRAYGEALVASAGPLVDTLAKVSLKPGGGHVALSFASLLRHLDTAGKAEIARAQMALLDEYANRVPDDAASAEYRRNYGDWAWEMERLA